MAIWYVDYEGGNDSNDGSSFALRKKNLNSLTAVQLAPGDTIRLMGSPDPTNLGVNATWTNKSATVTLASALNATVDTCDAAWTASANVTSTAETTVKRAGTGSAKHVIAAGFTTGLVAYKALGGATDFSGYQGITLWMYVSAALAASTLSIRLCSDAVGAVSVDTFALPAHTLPINMWIPVYVDKGSALGASIQSVALYADLDPGALTIQLDQIVAVKAAGNDCLHYKTLIGKNTGGTEPWWSIVSISGTTILLDANPRHSTTSPTPRGYYGTTETVATYIRQMISAQMANDSTSLLVPTDSGTAGNVITISGGWNRTDMSTQSLTYSWYDGLTGHGNGFFMSGAFSYLTIERVSFSRFNVGFSFSSTGSNGTLTGVLHCTNNITGLFLTGNNNNVATLVCNANLSIGVNQNAGQFNVLGTVHCLSAGTNTIFQTGYGWSHFGGTYTTITTLVCANNINSGTVGSSNGVTTEAVITTLTCDDNGQAGLTPGATAIWSHVKVGTLNVRNNGSHGWNVTENFPFWEVEVATITGNTGSGLNFGGNPLPWMIRSLTTSGNTTSAIAYAGSYHKQFILTSSMAEANKVVSSGAGNGYHTGGLVMRNYNGTAGDHRSFLGNGTVMSESSVRHTASGIAWKFSPTNLTVASRENSAIAKVVARVTCAAGTLVTVKAWVRRDNTSCFAKLVCPGHQIGGVNSDVSASISAAADTWEELTLTFTPSETGTVEIHYRVWNPTETSRSAYIDDLTISQA